MCIQIFATHPDPDFPEVSVLEQFQAQIASALAPAFGLESYPELIDEAAHVCATFLSVGIVQTPERMGRILKLLLQALDDIRRMLCSFLHFYIDTDMSRARPGYEDEQRLRNDEKLRYRVKVGNLNKLGGITGCELGAAIP